MLRQIAGLFVAEERGSHRFSGVPEPVTLFRLVRASGVRRRAGQRRLTPLVGRDEELARVSRLLQTSRLVTVVGPGGSGRTRLAVESAAAALGLSACAVLGFVDDDCSPGRLLGCGGSSIRPGKVPGPGSKVLCRVAGWRGRTAAPAEGRRDAAVDR